MDKNIRVLLVDDEADFIQLMTTWLASKGYSVIAAADGEMAVRMAREEKPDILLLDLRMPGIDGVEVLKKIRTFDKELPAIIISAYLADPIAEKAIAYGTSGVFYKGKNIEEIFPQLESILRSHKKLKNKEGGGDEKSMQNKVRVLLVDDETDFTQPVVFWLESKGYSVSVATNGKNALQLIEKEKPNIVFLDLRMPVMDGIETLRRIRQADKLLPVVIVTAEHSNEQKFVEARKLGCAGFFPKKEGIECLEKLIEATLRTHRDIKRR